MDAIVPQPQHLGAHGDPCSECGSPLAADQRYCLECGARRSEPRVDFRRYMAPEVAAAADAAPPTPAAVIEDSAPPESSRDHGPLAAVGGIAVLGLMLLVGVLIGKGDTPAAPVQPAPQVVRVGGPEGGSAAETTASAAGDRKDKAPAKGAGAAAKSVAGGLTGTAARQTTGTVQATTDDLEALQESTGEDYEETVKKLPDKIATPGAPPPIDKSKAPGGGGNAETIE